MTRQKAIQRLFHLWLAGAVLSGGIVSIQSIGGKYGNDQALAWSWYLAVVTAPTTLLTVAAFAEPKTSWKNAAADQFKFGAALVSSGLLLAVALGALLVEPLLEASPYEIFGETGVLIGLLQVAVMGAIGAIVFEKR